MMSALASLPDRLRLNLIDRLAPGLRKRRFDRALHAGQVSKLPRMIRTRDPFGEWTALFRTIDFFLSTGGEAQLPDLIKLARGTPGYPAHVWRAIALWQEGDRDQALAALDRLSTDDRVNGFQRTGAAAWAMFLQLQGFAPVSNATPPAFFQFWDRNPPTDITAEMDRWQAAARGCYESYDDRSAGAFITQHIGKREAALYASCPHPAIKSDYFRLCRLAVHGGIYVDADARMRKGFPVFAEGIGQQTVIWFRTSTPAMAISNGFIAAPAGAPLIVETLAEASRILTSGTPAHVFEHAGPTVLTKTALRLFRAQKLGAVTTLTDRQVATEVMTQIDASYKDDLRNWHLWQHAETRTAP